MGRHQIDLAPAQRWRLLVVRLERLQRQVQPSVGPGQPGAAGLLGHPIGVGFGEAQAASDRLDDRVVAASIDIDPQQLAVTELRDIDLPEVDLAVVAVGVEEPGGDRAQWTRASSAAAITAMTAVRYCRASIARSEAGSVSSMKSGLWVLSVSIDQGTSDVGFSISTPVWIACSRVTRCADTATRRARITPA